MFFGLYFQYLLYVKEIDIKKDKKKKPYSFSKTNKNIFIFLKIINF
jgi:hypothetical protein